jgi:hypothetical protein
MPNLVALLNAHDFGFLQALAETWGLPCTGHNAQAIARCLLKGMQESMLLDDILTALPKTSREALAHLKARGGKMPWAEFTYRFGRLRPMGPAKRSREQPHRFPASDTERLWYHGLLGREFLRGPEGLMECAYIPEEFLAAIPDLPVESEAAPPSLPSSAPTGHLDAPILEDSCTLLAALRRKDSQKLAKIAGITPEDQKILQGLLQGLGLLGKDSRSPTAAARPFLEQNRSAALSWLVLNWKRSTKVNELRLLPSLHCEGTWTNDPLKPRLFLLEQLRSLNAPVNLQSFIAALQDNAFDFLRPPVESANWMIANAQEPKQLLRGPASWPQVEAVWLDFMLTKLLPRMGLLNVQQSAGEVFISKSSFFDALLAGQSLPPNPEDGRVKIDPGGSFSVSNQVPRIARYQLSRFGDWLKSSPDAYRYQISAAALEEAASQGLTVAHFLSLLRKYAKSSPQALVRSLREWEANGSQIKVEQVQLLRLARPEILAQLREGPAAPYLGEALGPNAVLLRPGAVRQIKKALLRQGYLVVLPEDEEHDD